MQYGISVAQIAPTLLRLQESNDKEESEPFCRDLINKAQRTILHPWNPLPFELLEASDLSVLISHKFSLCTQHESLEVSYQGTTAWFLHIFEPTQKFSEPKTCVDQPARKPTFLAILPSKMVVFDHF